MNKPPLEATVVLQLRTNQMFLIWFILDKTPWLLDPF